MAVSVVETIPACPAGFVHKKTSEGIHEYQMEKNGLQILMLPDHSAPVVTLMITYRVGSRNEGAGLTGATHFLEHMMFKGTEKYNKDAGTSIFNTLQAVGAQVNATTWYDRTNYYELLPSEHLALAMQVESDRMRNLRLSKEDVASERTVILNELDRGQNDPVRNLYLTLWSQAYQAHTYRHPTIGWRNDVETVTAEGLRGFYETYYWPNNATLSLIGDVDPEEGFKLVEKYFGSIPSAPAEMNHKRTIEPPQNGERRFTLKQPGELGVVMMGWKSPPAGHNDTIALDLLGDVLSNGKNSRLYKKVVDAGKATFASASTNWLEDAGLFMTYVGLNPGITHGEVEALIREVIAEVIENGITEDELVRVKTAVNTRKAYERDGSFGIASHLNEAIAAGDWTIYTRFAEMADAVTVDDLQRVAKTWLLDDQCTIGFYEPTSVA